MTPKDEELTAFRTPKGIYCYQVTIYKRWVVPPPNVGESKKNEVEHVVAVYEVDKEDWRQPIINYLSYGILLENPRRWTEICHHAPRFLNYKDALHRRSFEGVLLQCLREDEALQALQEAHSGSPELLYPTVASWSFYTWRLDIIGRIPKYFGGHLYILAATNYFSKWAEVVALKEVKKENVANFTRQHNSSMYNDAANGRAEEFNKSLCNLLKKVISKSKQD
ncbi:uncharacterized protein [Nicotiana tomentosiformis]|uniref:uncharacterized protein n=1 Tax=Nicotiana tomentosiformis TaxID=4098 RepID=UPI00388CA928